MTAPAMDSSNGLFDRIRRWTGHHPYWMLALITVAALFPFLVKPFNMDDPLFIWTAHHIQAHPANPYGFDVNWYGTALPMWNVTENPPLASYYMALTAGILGWSEMALHTAFLLPALAVILGTFRLARHFCNRPLLAALAALLTPVFLVSSSTVMCDVLMLAFWVWAVVFWVEGMERDHLGRLFCAALLITLAALTKYFGACLIPLLAAHGLICKRRFGWWAVCLLIPLAALAAYQWITWHVYGYPLISQAVNYARSAKKKHVLSAIAGGFTSLTFTGGCLAVAVFFMPLLWRKRTLAAMICGAVCCSAALILSLKGDLLRNYYAFQSPADRTFAEFQILFWTTGGVCILMLAVADVFRHRDARSGLLALWVFGTFFFTAFLNWVVNGRSILPMAPVVGILLARRLDLNVSTGWKNRPRIGALCLAAGALLALLVARADFLLAITFRQSAQLVFTRFGQEQKTFWFQGHWGFQYYMDKLGATAMDKERSEPKAGEKFAIPLNNTGVFLLDSKIAAQRAMIVIDSPAGLSTWNASVGAGFYASNYAPMPFGFGRVAPEYVLVYELKSDVTAPMKTAPVVN